MSRCKRTGGYAAGAEPRWKRSTVQDEAHAREYLSTHDVKSSDMCYKSNIAEWQYASDITDENQRLKVCLFLIHLTNPDSLT